LDTKKKCFKNDKGQMVHPYAECIDQDLTEGILWYRCPDCNITFPIQYKGFEEVDNKLRRRIMKEVMSDTEERAEAKLNPLDQQIGGSHYKDFKIQPIEFIIANNLDFIQGNVVKYICRYKHKGGLQDLIKIKHYLDIIISMAEKGNGKEIQHR